MLQTAMTIIIINADADADADSDAWPASLEAACFHWHRAVELRGPGDDNRRCSLRMQQVTAAPGRAPIHGCTEFGPHTQSHLDFRHCTRPIVATHLHLQSQPYTQNFLHNADRFKTKRLPRPHGRNRPFQTSICRRRSCTPNLGHHHHRTQRIRDSTAYRLFNSHHTRRANIRGRSGATTERPGRSLCRPPRPQPSLPQRKPQGNQVRSLACRYGPIRLAFPQSQTRHRLPQTPQSRD